MRSRSNGTIHSSTNSVCAVDMMSIGSDADSAVADSFQKSTSMFVRDITTCGPAITTRRDWKPLMSRIMLPTKLGVGLVVESPTRRPCQLPVETVKFVPSYTMTCGIVVRSNSVSSYGLYHSCHVPSEPKDAPTVAPSILKRIHTSSSAPVPPSTRTSVP